MSISDDRRFAIHAAELRARGEEALGALPDPGSLKTMPASDRHQVLEPLRLELYAIASLLADTTVKRVRQGTADFPPYGLARSMHSQSRMVVANPQPFEDGSVDSFEALGRALLDTTVFYMDRQYKEQFASDQGWLLRRLERLLALFRADAGPATRARYKDGFAFLYGGLHFGVSVCVQLAEVMTRVLASYDMSARDKAKVMIRSVRPANRLAALNFDHVVPTYQALLEPSGWMSADHFDVEVVGGSPSSIDIRDDSVLEGSDRPTTYPTQGCPARRSPSGGQSAIALLWRWTAELSRDTGLLAQDDLHDDDGSGGGEEGGSDHSDRSVPPV